MTVPFIMADFSSTEWVLLGVILVTAFIARIFIIFVLLPVLSHYNICQTVNTAYKTVMVWGGLRGAVSLALALAVYENPQIDSEIRGFIGLLVTGFVLFTLFVNATTVRLVINFFNLSKLSTIDVAIRDRATTISLHQISNNLNQLAEELEVDGQVNEALARGYQHRQQALRKRLQKNAEITTSQWDVIGLTHVYCART